MQALNEADTAVLPAKAPANPIGASPLRIAGSIRRTSTIDTEWPEGLGPPMRMRGHARDFLTGADGVERVLDAAQIELLVSMRREILSISASRRNDEVQALIGSRGGGHLRAELARVIPEELAGGTPLYLLLDDLSGASLVAGWAWSRWSDDWLQRQAEGRKTTGRNGTMEGVCTGFRPGSSALMDDGTSNPHLQSSARVPPLLNPDDPIGWHELARQSGVGMRRARRIDVWLEDVVCIDVGFQDSATAPDGGDRIAVHEYHVTARADPVSFEVLSLVSDPRVLPYRECPGASDNMGRILGESLADLRAEVPVKLFGTLGCTHLNDVLRSMADVPQLVGRLRTGLEA